MNESTFCELTEVIVDKAKEAIENQKNSLFDVSFSSSAGLDYDPPHYDVSVKEITGFILDGDSAGEIRFDITVEASLSASKFDGGDKDIVPMGTFCGVMETSCTVKYRIRNNKDVEITGVVFDETTILVDADA